MIKKSKGMYLLKCDRCGKQGMFSDKTIQKSGWVFPTKYVDHKPVYECYCQQCAVKEGLCE